MDLEPELKINWYLLWLILGTVVLTKLLRAGNPKICKTLTLWWVSEPVELVNLRREVSRMRQQLQRINMMDNFADHARLQRRIIQLEQGLQVKEKGHQTMLKWLGTLLGGCLTFLTLVVRVGVVVYHRKVPVATVPTELFYPLSSILALPTGLLGAIGCPLWGVACSHFIDTIMYSLNVA